MSKFADIPTDAVESEVSAISKRMKEVPVGSVKAPPAVDHATLPK